MKRSMRDYLRDPQLPPGRKGRTMMKIALAHAFFGRRTPQKQIDVCDSSPAQANAFAIFVIVLATAITPGRAAAQLPACPAMIDACGCVIKNSGLFGVVSSTLSTTGTTSCIVIRAKNISINLAGTSITGPNNGSSAGAGIEIDRGSSNVFIEGNGATISGFEFGIENEATNVTVEDLTAKNNDEAGVHFAKASNSAISAVTAQNNGGYGIWLEGSTQNKVGGNTQVLTNVLDGILIGCQAVVGTGICSGITAQSNQNTVFNVTATNNGTGNSSSGGVTVQFNSKDNSIARSSGSGNAKADFYNHHNAGTCGGNVFFLNSGTNFGGCTGL
jgi:parallel beta-helix repeat protein